MPQTTSELVTQAAAYDVVSSLMWVPGTDTLPKS
jgi:hypothetical protein